MSGTAKLVGGPYHNDTVVGPFEQGESVVVGGPGYEAEYEYVGGGEAVWVPDYEDAA